MSVTFNPVSDKMDYRIIELDKELFEHFREIMSIDTDLSRSTVSFQSNKKRAIYRWYKYKEAFSASLVEYLLSKYAITTGPVMDPFAGIGTTLFATSKTGLDSVGIELLPVGQQLIEERVNIERNVNSKEKKLIANLIVTKPWNNGTIAKPIKELRITKFAYPPTTMEKIGKYLSWVDEQSNVIQGVLKFALLCILESISYTRKDGQYLRWDFRSGRKIGEKPFNKGVILDFDTAITEKLREICFDLDKDIIFPDLQFGEDKTNSNKKTGKIEIIKGSCLEILPSIEKESFEAIITSPPYCNRYDYTRTYALELALLEASEELLAKLRQAMISCTVENKAKDLLQINPLWTTALEAVNGNELLQTILHNLEYRKINKELNNNGIPRMIRGYFYEMACVIQECFRILKPRGKFFMVNDNVRYSGISISVDLILSKIAESIGFKIDNIFLLPSGKGNSSQQMGKHGREVLRKCLYLWSKR